MGAADVRKVRFIVVPYHVGIANERVGKGPARLLKDGIEAAVAAAGAVTEVLTIAPVSGFEGEIGRSFELKRRVSQAVSDATGSGLFPIVLAGNCNTTVGVHAGLRDREAGLVWFDAHADFDTPDEHTSGYFDGMGVATLAGRCWRKLAATIPGFEPIATDKILYCGIRDFEPGQEECVRRHGISSVFGSTNGPTDYAKALRAKLGQISFRRAVVHLDLDCLDTSVGRANEYAAPGGLSADELVECVDEICCRIQPRALTIASFDPDLKGAERISEAATSAALAVVQSLQPNVSQSPA